MCVVLAARLGSSACVEVDSDTEAVVGKEFRLGCISCKMRGEVEATATVDWWFMAMGESDFTHVSDVCFILLTPLQQEVNPICSQM